MSEILATPLGSVLKKRNERARGAEELLSVTAGQGVVKQSEAGRRDISSDDKSNYRLVQPGDIVYNTMRMWQGVSGTSAYAGIVSPAYTVCRPTDDIDPRFAGYLLRLPQLVQEFENRSQGLVSDTWNLKYSEFAKIVAPIPPVEDQRRIAEILDAVDEAICSTARLIAKLEARGSGLLDHLLSRLEPGNVKPLDYGLRYIEAGKSPDLPDIPANNGQWGVLKVSAVRPRGFNQDENKVVANPVHIDPRFEVRAGDLLITRANTPQLVGLTCYVRSTRPRLLLSDKTLRLVIDPTVADAQFISLALGTNRARTQIETSGTGSSGSMKNISQAEIRSLTIAFPELSHQKQIVAASNLINRNIETSQNELTKLRLVKRGLTEDLLTGRVRIKR